MRWSARRTKDQRLPAGTLRPQGRENKQAERERKKIKNKNTDERRDKDVGLLGPRRRTRGGRSALRPRRDSLLSEDVRDRVPGEVLQKKSSHTRRDVDLRWVKGNERNSLRSAGLSMKFFFSSFIFLLFFWESEGIWSETELRRVGWRLGFVFASSLVQRQFTWKMKIVRVNNFYFFLQ